MYKLILLACSLMIILSGCTRESINTAAPIPLPGRTPGNPVPPADSTANRDEYGPNDPYVDRDEYPGGTMIWIKRTNSFHNESLELLYSQDKKLIQASESNIYYNFSRATTNSTFSYDFNNRRTGKSWEHIYDQNNQLREIRYTDSILKLIFNVSKNKLDQYTRIIKFEVARGFQTDSAIYKYVYNAAGDPTHVDCYSSSSAGDNRSWSIEMEFTQEISILNNDPMTHFANLFLWAYWVPIVSNHLPASMKMINSGLDFDLGNPDMSDELAFYYEFDSEHRPVKINLTDISGVITPANKSYEVTYVNLY
jgi:hypothetical protein